MELSEKVPMYLERLQDHGRLLGSEPGGHPDHRRSEYSGKKTIACFQKEDLARCAPSTLDKTIKKRAAAGLPIVHNIIGYSGGPMIYSGKKKGQP